MSTSKAARPVSKFIKWLAPSRAANADILAFRDLVRDELAHQPYPPGYVVSARWQDIIRHIMESTVDMDGTQIAAFGMTQQFDVGPQPVDVEYLRSSRARYITLHQELTPISESKLMPDLAVADCDGTAFSHSLEQAFSYYHDIVDGIGAAPLTHVVEIGSGYGRFVRLLRLVGRANHFTLIDLPQSLVFAFAFLRVHFPRSRIKIITAPDDIYPAMERYFDFVLCPVQFAESLTPENVDLLVNTYSLGEMPQGCVDYLMGLIHTRLRPTHFYSLNSMFTNKNLHFDIGYLGEGNEVVLNLEPRWWPITFKIANSVDAGAWRSTASTVLKRVGIPADKLVVELLAAASKLNETSDLWLGYMYFASLWCADGKIVDKFLDGLRRRQRADGFDSSPSYSFDTLGEVVFLRRRASDKPACNGMTES